MFRNTINMIFKDQKEWSHPFTNDIFGEWKSLIFAQFISNKHNVYDSELEYKFKWSNFLHISDIQ